MVATHTKQGSLLSTASSFFRPETPLALAHSNMAPEWGKDTQSNRSTRAPKHCGNFYGTEGLTRSTQNQRLHTGPRKGAGKGSPKDTSFLLAFHFSSIRRLSFLVILFPCSVLRAMWMNSKAQCLLNTFISSDKCITHSPYLMKLPNTTIWKSDKGYALKHTFKKI